jgi:hypothetical protein
MREGQLAPDDGSGAMTPECIVPQAAPSLFVIGCAFVLIACVSGFLAWRLGYGRGYERGREAAARLFASKGVRSAAETGPTFIDGL